MLDMAAAKYSVFVAYRGPEHTFPSDAAVHAFFGAIWNSLKNARGRDLLTLPYGRELLDLRTYIVAEQRSKGYFRGGLSEACVAHYIHFWRLLSVAIEHSIPHVKIENLLLARTAEDIAVVLERAGICSQGDAAYRRIAEELFKQRQKKTWMHTNRDDLQDGINFTSSLYEMKEADFNKSQCRHALADLMSFCDDNVRGCRGVNRVYGHIERPRDRTRGRRR